MEARSATLPGEAFHPLISPLQGINPIDSPTLKASLNRRLLFTSPTSVIAPGDVYEPMIAFQTDGFNAFPTLDEILEDIAQKGKADQLKDTCVLIAVEITPICDYQQLKMKFPPFACGVAVLSKNTNQLKAAQTGFLRRMPIVYFADTPLEGTRVIVWNSHYVVSTPPSQVPEGQFLLRLRYAPLLDIQAWLGNQNNRPGYLFVWRLTKRRKAPSERIRFFKNLCGM